jgi:hypothetical protein
VVSAQQMSEVHVGISSGLPDAELKVHVHAPVPVVVFF